MRFICLSSIVSTVTLSFSKYLWMCVLLAYRSGNVLCCSPSMFRCTCSWLGAVTTLVTSAPFLAKRTGSSVSVFKIVFFTEHTARAACGRRSGELEWRGQHSRRILGQCRRRKSDSGSSGPELRKRRSAREAEAPRRRLARDVLDQRHLAYRDWTDVSGAELRRRR